MALSARPVNLNAAPSAPSGRIPSGTHASASMFGGSVDAVDSRVEIQSNTHYGFEGYSDWAKHQQQAPANYDPLTNTSGQFETFSSLFVNLLDSQQNGTANTDVTSEAKRLNPSFVDKAIRAYEGTAIVINGPSKPLGRSLSISM